MNTNKAARFMAHNLVYVAGLLNREPIPTRLADLTEEARAESADECPPQMN